MKILVYLYTDVTVKGHAASSLFDNIHRLIYVALI